MPKSQEQQLEELDLQLKQLKEKQKQVEVRRNELLKAQQKKQRANRDRRCIILGSRAEAYYKTLNITFDEFGNDIPQNIQDDLYRYIAIGHTFETALGKTIPLTSLNKLSAYVKNQEERGSFISKALSEVKEKKEDNL